MSGDIFYWLANMSITASLAGLVVLLLRAIPRLPRRAVCLLWCIPLIRMWVPVGIGSRWSLMTLISRVTTRTVKVWEPADGYPAMIATNYIMAAEDYFPITYRVNLLDRIFRAAAVIWLCVAVAILLTLCFLYIMTRRELRDAEHLRDELYLSDKVTSPALYGVLRPRIILPCGWESREDLPLILAHERAHLRRGDNVWRVVGFVTAAVHWFNPLSWLFLRRFLSDLELGCDERVLRSLTEEERRDYARALVESAERRAERYVFASAFGGARIRLRVDRILRYRPLSVLSTVCAAALLIAVAFVLLTNAN